VDRGYCPSGTACSEAVLQRCPRQCLFQRPRLRPQHLDLVRGRFPGRVAGQPPLARLQRLLQTTIVHALGDAFLAAQLGNTGLPTRPLPHDPALRIPPSIADASPDGSPRPAFRVCRAFDLLFRSDGRPHSLPTKVPPTDHRTLNGEHPNTYCAKAVGMVEGSLASDRRPF
jgi:hypothetical protein